MRAISTLLLAITLGLGNLTAVEARERVRAGLDEPGLVDEYDQPQYDQPKDEETYDQIAQEQDAGIPPSEAAAIARDVVPGAKVVGVKLLSNGWYAVTLRSKGSVTRVMVNATDGSVR